MLILPVAAVLGAATCFAVASVLQDLSASRTERGGAVNPLLLVRLGRQAPFLVGLGLDAVGFVLTAWALRLLPLFFVQAGLASTLAITAVVAAAAARESLAQPERWALAGVIAGLVLLAVSATPGHEPPTGGAMTAVLMAGLPLLVAIAAVLDRSPDAPWSGVAFGALSGFCFAGFGMASHVLGAPGRPALVADPLFWSLLAYVGLGLLLYGTALQRGKVTTVTAASVVVETLVPAAVGVAVLGDAARPGLGVVAVAGFLLTIGAALSLARSSSPVSPPPSRGYGLIEDLLRPAG